MPWKPLPRIAFAVCIYPFNPSSAADLPLQIGDELYIIEQGGKDGAWYRGYLVAPPSLLAGLTSSKGQALEARVFSGIFPRDCVEIRELLGEVTKYGHEEFATALNGDSGASSDIADHSHGGGRDSPAISGEWPKPPRGVPGITPRDSNQPEIPAKEATNGSVSQISVRGKIQKPPAPVPMLKIGDETATSKEEPLVDEIGSCLREWHSTDLHQFLLSRRYDLLQEMFELVNRLDSARRQLIHKILTKKELEDVRESAIWDLVNGNKLLSGEVIVRSKPKKGRVLTAEDSPVEISKLQSMMSLLDEHPKHHTESKSLHHLLFQLRSFVNDAVKPTTFAVAVYCKSESGEPKIISEVFAIDATAQDTSEDVVDKADFRTLFTNLNVAHIKATTAGSAQFYLVIKVITTETVQENSKPMSVEVSNEDSLGNLPSSLANTGSKTPNGKSSRRSLIGRKISESSARRPQSKPMSVNSATPKKLLARATASRDEFGIPRRQTISIKRTTGVGLLNITDMLLDDAEFEQQVTIWSPTTDRDGFVDRIEDWDDIVREMLPAPSKTYKTSSSVSRVVVGLKSFSHPNSEELIQTTPTLLQNIHSTQHIGFAEAPTRPRSDIYLTLSEPYLPLNSFLSHPKAGSIPVPSDAQWNDLQLTLEVRNVHGDRIENCIYPSSNSAGHTAWRTTAVERGGVWNQTIRLAISPDDVPGCHIVMSIADASVNFPFALGWMPLWVQEAFVRDGEHSLVLYRYDEHTSEMIAGKRAYLALPWNPKTKDETVTGPIASLYMRTYLCSTKYSQDPTLLGLLRWREQRAKELLTLLKRFSLIQDIEIVKLLNDVLNTLFEILVHFSSDEEFEDALFTALTTVLGIVHDRRFNLQPLVDSYIRTQFNFPFAFPCLTRSLCRLLSDPKDPEFARKLRATFKVGNHIFRFIVMARQQQIIKEEGIGIKNHPPTFGKDLQSIFNAIDTLMHDKSPELIGTKTLLAQNLHHWLPEFSNVLSGEEIYNLTRSFLDSFSDAPGKLLLFRMVFINNVTALDLFHDVDIKSQWHKDIVRWLAPYWAEPDHITQQWREQIRLSCSIIASEINRDSEGSVYWMQKLVDAFMVIQKSPRPPTKSFSLLFPTNYPFPSRQVDQEMTFDESLVEISALVAALSQDALQDPTLPKEELFGFLIKTMRVYKSVLDCKAFPSTWLTLHIRQHDATLQALRAIYTLLTERFLPQPDDAEQFPTEVWNEFFSTLLKLVSSKALALETFPEQKRRAVWKIAGDVRELGAELLEQSWEAIGWETNSEDKKLYNLDRMSGYQVQYVPSHVGPVVELCLSVHEGLRGTAINVLRTMIISEWSLSQDLGVIQTEIINCLDKLFKNNPPRDGMLHKLFVSEMVQTFEDFSQTDAAPLFAAVKKLFDVVDELLDLLVAVHSSDTESSGEAFRILDTLRLMEFLRDMQKELIYVGYVHKLALVQAKANNPTEAGLALKMHAELYDWDNSTMLEPLTDPHFPAQTSFDRKEQLYFQMIQSFEEGQAWHQALDAYTEIAFQYQHNAFDFAKLSRTQRAMATIYERIGRGERHNPRFFRVIFRGLGFPSTFRDKEYIFEGSQSDRMSGFADKLLQQYPSAQIVTSATADDLEGQYISIYPVGPHKDLTHPVNRRLKTSQAVRDHFLLSRPKKFAMSSRRQASVLAIKDQIQEKTIYTTAETFPTTLRRSEIVKTETIQLQPVQIGLERTMRKTQELSALEAKAQDTDEQAFNALTDSLRNLLRPNSSGCVADYWKLIPQSQDGFDLNGNVDGGGRPGNKLSPLEEALKIALMDHAATIRRCLSKYTKSSRQPVRAELTREFEETFAPAIDALNILSSQPTADLTNPQWLWNLNAPNPEPNNVAPGQRFDEPDTRGGAIEAFKGTASSGTDSQAQKDTTGNMKAPGKDGMVLLSSRTSVSNDLRASESTSKPDSAADRRPAAKPSSSSSSLQARVGSVTKRLSGLNIGRKGTKGNAPKSTVESVAE